MRLVVEERFRIWREPDHEPRGHLCEPRMVRLSTGEILLSFRTGSLRYSADGLPRLLSSADDGRSWTDLGRPLWDVLPGPAGWDYRAASLAELKSGSVLVCCVGLDRSSTERPPWLVYNPDPNAYQGMIPIRNVLSRSADGGRTWAPTWHMAGLTVPNSSAQCLAVLADGTVLCPLETFKDFDQAGPWRYRVDVVRSRDDGLSWGENAPAHVSDPEGDPRYMMAWDPRLGMLDDGRLVQLYYVVHNRGGGEGPVHVGWSSDGGRTWVVPRPTNLHAQATYPIALSGGRLIGFAQRRQDPQGMVACLSTDGGETFDPDAQVVVYEHDRPSAPGLAPGGDVVRYMNDMIHFTFGHPSGVALGSDRAFVVWYAGDEVRTEVWGAHVRIDGAPTAPTMADRGEHADR